MMWLIEVFGKVIFWIANFLRFMQKARVRKQAKLLTHDFMSLCFFLRCRGEIPINRRLMIQVPRDLVSRTHHYRDRFLHHLRLVGIRSNGGYNQWQEVERWVTKMEHEKGDPRWAIWCLLWQFFAQNQWWASFWADGGGIEWDRWSSRLLHPKSVWLRIPQTKLISCCSSLLF